MVDTDLIMSIGSRWDDRITGKTDVFCTDAVKIHIDIDPAEINKVVSMDCAIIGDAKTVVETLSGIVEPGDTKAWIDQIRKWKKQFPLKPRHSDCAWSPIGEFPKPLHNILTPFWIRRQLHVRR